MAEIHHEKFTFSRVLSGWGGGETILRHVYKNCFHLVSLPLQTEIAIATSLFFVEGQEKVLCDLKAFIYVTGVQGIEDTINGLLEPFLGSFGVFVCKSCGLADGKIENALMMFNAGIPFPSGEG